MLKNQNRENLYTNLNPLPNCHQTVSVPVLATETLSPHALGLFTYILSRPANWRGSYQHIAKATRQTLSQINKSKDELLAKGWLVHE